MRNVEKIDYQVSWNHQPLEGLEWKSLRISHNWIEFPVNVMPGLIHGSYRDFLYFGISVSNNMIYVSGTQALISHYYDFMSHEVDYF